MQYSWNKRHSVRRPPSPPRATLVVPAILGAVAGALVQYLLDPARGRARRAKLRDRSVAAVRRPMKRVRRTSGQKVTYLRGRARGMGHRLAPSGPPVDDRTLVDKVRSEVLGSPRFGRYSLNVDAADGVVVLRGQVDERDAISDLVGAVGKVTGVRRVENLLHTPHTVAPNVQPVQQPGP
jgi:osmotically-inducible protein OsmY